MKQEENLLSVKQQWLLLSSTALNKLVTKYAELYVNEDSSQERDLYIILRSFQSHLTLLTNYLVASETQPTSETIPENGQTISMSDKSGTTISIRIDND